MRTLTYLVAGLMLSAFAVSGLLVLVATWALRDIPAAPTPRPAVRTEPPASRAGRLWARLTTCLRRGHTYRIAFPHGRMAQQCTHCGTTAARLADKPTGIRTRRA